MQFFGGCKLQLVIMKKIQAYTVVDEIKGIFSHF